MKTMNSARIYVGVAAALIAVLGGIVTFCGWAFEVRHLTDWFGAGVTMKANAALATTAIGLALLCVLLRPAHLHMMRVCAMFAGLLGGLTLIEHLTGWDLRLDTLLFAEPAGERATAAPGRMGPPAASSFVLLSVAVSLLSSERGHRVASTLALVVLGISTLSLVGYWFGAELMYTVPRLTGISLQMAFILAAMSVGIIVAADHAGPMKILSQNDDARSLAARLFPAALIIPLATGWLRIQGERAGFYDQRFGTALRTVVEIVLLSALAWWAVAAIRVRDHERRRAENERESIERKFRSVLDASAVPFSIFAPVRDPTGRIVDLQWSYLNSAAATAHGCEPGELIGRRLQHASNDWWTGEGVFERLAAVIEHDTVEQFELHVGTNGVQSWFQVIASPLDHHVAVWFSDVTERKRQEIALRDADRRKDEFLATLAHELRNPLAPIRQASSLSRRPELDEAKRQWCGEVIERQVQHMALLLDDLLDVSRITRGALPLRRQVVSIQSVVSTAIETARPLIDSKKHEFRANLPADDVLVNVDSVRMSQVISNLLNNAAKYTDGAGLIRLEVNVRGATLVLRVSDNGAGIAPAHFQDIFTMFAQIRTGGERTESGLGIGLALTKGLVELHGGTIEVKSAGLGSGSTFSVTMPNVVVRERTHEDSGHEHPELRPSRRILVADDNVDAAESLATLFRLDGHEVHVVHDGESALSAALELKPDVALLDLGMPRLTGHEVAARIRESVLGRRPLLIAVTGWGQSGDRERSMRAGFDHHFTKPIHYGQLTGLLPPRPEDH
jgi:signal transduction histidine kinase/CheY-like chemotaxis protein